MAAIDGESNHETGKLELEQIGCFYESFNTYGEKHNQRRTSTLDVPFPSSHEAVIALQSLSPDREPRKGGISKQLTVSGSTLSVRWRADEARILRVSVSSFLDHLSLVMETMEMFGPPVAQ